jgi:2-hydroxychromene-2-carboxylate isomerase
MIGFWFNFASAYLYPAAMRVEEIARLDRCPVQCITCVSEGFVDDPLAVFASANAETAKSRLRDNAERAIELGIFGALTSVVGDELFWGNGRLEAALASRRAGLSKR